MSNVKTQNTTFETNVETLIKSNAKSFRTNLTAGPLPGPQGIESGGDDIESGGDDIM